MSWQGNSFSSARARERGSALTISIVESGDYFTTRKAYSLEIGLRPRQHPCGRGWRASFAGLFGIARAGFDIIRNQLQLGEGSRNDLLVSHSSTSYERTTPC